MEKLGVKLAGYGWNVLPLKPASKVPALRGWQDFEPDVTKVRQWLGKGMGRYSIGINTRHTPAVDLDILDSEAAERMLTAVEEIAGTTLIRTGRKPKALLLYRSDEVISKLKSARYEDEFGCAHHVEILGAGQQFAAYGIHPDTLQPYTWSAPLEDFSPEQLPTLTVAMAQEILSAFEGVALSLGWTRVTNEKERSPLTDEELAIYRLLPKPENVDVPQVLATLVNDADERDSWIRVGMALHHHYDGSDEGLDLWDSWSQQTQTGKYDLGAVYTAWYSFKDNITTKKKALITMRSLIKRAHEIEKTIALKAYANGEANKLEANGHALPTKAEDVDPRSKMSAMLARYVFVRGANSVHDLKRPAQDADTPYQAWRNMMLNELIPKVSEDGEIKYKPAGEEWVRSEKRLTAERTIFDPSAERLVRRGEWLYVNSFAIPQVNPDQGWMLDDPRLSIFMDHMEYLIPDEVEREWFINWLAFTVSRPELRSKVTPLHISQPHGTGRGWVHELLATMLGHWNCKKTTMAVFSGEGGAGQFQDYLHRSLVVSIEEVKDGGKRFGVDDRVRDKLEAPRLEVNLKYGGKETINVYANFFLMSNHIDALVISEHDRRIQVLTGPSYVETRAYFTRLYKWLDGEGPEQLRHVLCRRDLSLFNWQRSTATKGRDRLIKASVTDTGQAFKEWMDNQHDGLQFTLDGVVAALSCEPYNLPECNEKELAHLVRENAYKGDGRVTLQGRRVTPWVLNKSMKG